MKDKTPIILKRDCSAVMIPSGEKIALSGGSSVWMTQALGESYTVMTDRGYMVRVDGRDAAALGMASVPELKPENSAAADSAEEVEKQVWHQLRSCFDPEIPVNIVDLGLIYHCVVTPLPAAGYKAAVWDSFSRKIFKTSCSQFPGLAKLTQNWYGIRRGIRACSPERRSSNWG